MINLKVIRLRDQRWVSFNSYYYYYLLTSKNHDIPHYQSPPQQRNPSDQENSQNVCHELPQLEYLPKLYQYHHHDFDSETRKRSKTPRCENPNAQIRSDSREIFEVHQDVPGIRIERFVRFLPENRWGEMILR